MMLRHCHDVWSIFPAFAGQLLHFFWHIFLDTCLETPHFGLIKYVSTKTQWWRFKLFKPFQLCQVDSAVACLGSIFFRAIVVQLRVGNPCEDLTSCCWCFQGGAYLATNVDIDLVRELVCCQLLVFHILLWHSVAWVWCKLTGFTLHVSLEYVLYPSSGIPSAFNSFLTLLLPEIGETQVHAGSNVHLWYSKCQVHVGDGPQHHHGPGFEPLWWSFGTPAECCLRLFWSVRNSTPGWIQSTDFAWWDCRNSKNYQLPQRRRNHRSVQCFREGPPAWGHSKIHGEGGSYPFQSLHHCEFAHLSFGLGRSFRLRWPGRLPEISTTIWQPFRLALRLHQFYDGSLAGPCLCFGFNPAVTSHQSLGRKQRAGCSLADDAGIPLLFLGAFLVLPSHDLWSCTASGCGGKIWLYLVCWLLSRFHHAPLVLVVPVCSQTGRSTLSVSYATWVTLSFTTCWQRVQSLAAACNILESNWIGKLNIVRTTAIAETMNIIMFRNFKLQ